MAIIPTVHIKSPHFPGGMVINESDYDPKIHELWEAPKSASQPEPASKPEVKKNANSRSNSRRRKQ